MNELADGEDAPKKKTAKAAKPAFSGFDALGDDIEDEDEDEGGLMVCLLCYAGEIALTPLGHDPGIVEEEGQEGEEEGCGLC